MATHFHIAYPSGGITEAIEPNDLDQRVSRAARTMRAAVGYAMFDIIECRRD